MAGSGPAAVAAGGAAAARRRQDRGHPRHRAAPSIGCAPLMHLPGLRAVALLRRGWRCCARCKAKVPIVARPKPRGRGRRPAARGRVRRAARRVLPADLLLLHQGVVPNVNLAMAAGIEHRWNARQLCFEPVLDEDFDSSVPGIAVAGDGAGIAGGTAAAERGRIAAIAAVRALRPEAAVPDTQAVAPEAAARGDGPGLPRLPLSPGRCAPPARGRDAGLPLRGSDGAAGARYGAHGLRGAEPDEGLPALRHGPVPGQARAASPSPS